MASIAHDKNGLKRILFTGIEGKRQSIRLGKVTERTANEVKRGIESILAASGNGVSIDRETADWLGRLKKTLYAKLVVARLAARRNDHDGTALAKFITAYIAGRTDVKPATKEVWRQGEMGLIKFYGGTRQLAEINPGDADAYKLALVGEKLAPMTIRKRLQFAKTIFRAAVRNRLIGANPFDDVTVKAIKSGRKLFVSHADTEKLTKSCPDHHWRTIVALARYGGIRCPSEVLSLRWGDVDWEAGRMRVISPKTEHHPGKESRMVPLFPELMPALQEAFELAVEGAVHVVDERFRKAAIGKDGWRNVNLRTTFEKIIHRAGLTAWPRLFHSLRASRQTELQETFPMHVVCAWMGNSIDVAQEHYLQVTDEHFNRASKAAQKAAQYESVSANMSGEPVAQKC